MTRHNRKRFLVDNKVQLSLLKRMIVHWLLFVALFIGLVIAVESGFRGPGTSVAEIVQQTLEKYAMPLIIMVALMPAFLYDAIKLSNRFVGPIYRLKKGLSSLANCQETPELKFRKGDFWGDLADDFNNVAKRLSSTSQSSTD